MKRLYGATLNSMRGLAYGARHEAALKGEIVALLLAVAIVPLAAPGPGWGVAMVGVMLFILAVELLNTAIEKFADHVAPERHPAVGLIKDMGSAAVFCALAFAAVVWVTALALRFGLL